MLQVRMLGSLSFEADQQLIRPELGHSGSLLACYLLQFPDRLHRCARLVDLFWPDLAPDKARSAFNTAKWRLRKLLSEHSESEFVLRIADDLMFKGSPSVVVDTHTLDRAAKSIPCHASAESLTQEDEDRIANAVLAYSGPFLEGEDGEWILQERKRLQASLLKAAVHLMRVSSASR
jgi:DNA-binding SARP family transcriptional activator